jgi:hypothetical protein
MDFENHIARVSAHCEQLFKDPGWRDYIRAKTAELAKTDSMYAELAARFNPPQPPRSSAARRPTGR